MKLAVSNIAWMPKDRLSAYQLLTEFGFSGLEIAPGLLFHDADDPFNPTEQVIIRALEEIHDAGLSLVSMQSLLFGVEGAALFESVEARSRFETGIERAINLAGRVGIPNLVFGSPKQRIVPRDMSKEDAWSEAAMLFRRMGDTAQAANTLLAIESNPAAYGTNFLNTLEEASSFVSEVNHPAVKVILDIGAMHMNGEFGSTPEQISSICMKLSHVHISEPNLNPAPADEKQAETILKALKVAGYNRAVSIEMKAPQGGLGERRTCVERLARAATKVGVA